MDVVEPYLSGGRGAHVRLDGLRRERQMTTLDPRATAVLVIDVQVGVFETDPPPLDSAGVLARINQVTDKSRSA